jgi:hypothetical protein
MLEPLLKANSMTRVRGFKNRLEYYTVRDTNPKGCWLWAMAVNAKGYGVCSEGLVHRASYKMAFGDIPAGKYVLHRCDVRRCCNPEHLYVGTQKDNMRDMLERKRLGSRGQPKGQRHAKAKLTDALVMLMRAMAKAGETTDVLADRFKISQTQVRRVVAGRQWGHLPL